jgi:hypothetical protein
VYAIPPDLGTFDVATYSSVLLHMRDPFLALAKGARLAKKAVIVVEPYGRLFRFRRALSGLRRLMGRVPVLGAPYLRFLPNAVRGQPTGTWWALGPEVIREMLALVGFRDTTVTWHFQKHQNRMIRCFTLVARRTNDVPLLEFL